jgi:hypothetical protein
MRNIFYSLRLVPVILLALLLNACGMLTFSNLLGVNTLGGAATIAAEDLNVSEVELFDSGPVDIPVSIAKLDSPDTTLIEVLIADNSVGDASPFLVRVRTLEVDTSYTFTFTGLTGAVADPVTTPYILLSNTQTGLYSVGNVSATGTFVVSLDGETEQDFILTAMTTSDLTTAQASPVLIYSADAQGAISITTTNSSDLTLSTIVVDNVGNTYFSNLTDAGTYNFWRRNINGAEPTLLLSDIIYPIRLVSVFNESSFVFLDEAGQLIMASGDAPIASLRTLRATSELNVADESLFYTPVTLDNFDLSGLPADVLLINDALPYSLVTLPGRGVLLLKQFDAGAEAGDSADIVVFIDTEGVITTIVPASETILGSVVTYDAVHAGLATAYGMITLSISDTTSANHSGYSLDLSGDLYPPDEAWEHKILLGSNIGAVTGVGVGNEFAVYSVVIADNLKELRVTKPSANTERVIVQYNQNDDPFADLVKVSADGLYAVTCRVYSHGFYVIPLSEDLSLEPVLFATSGLCRMKDVAIDPENRVYFYALPNPSEASGSDNPAQLTFIDLDDVPIVQEALGQ